MTDALAVDDQVPRYRTRRAHHRGFGVAINLTHAKVSREKPPTPAAKPEPAAAIVPAVANPHPPVVGRAIASYEDVISVFRDRCDELEVSRNEIDHLSGLATGYASVLLSKSTTPRKIFGPLSLGRILDALGLRLLVIENSELTARTLRRRTRRVSTHAHYRPEFAPIGGPIKGWLFGYPAPIAGKPNR